MTGTPRSRGLLAVPLALGVAGCWAQAVSTDEKESDMTAIEVTVTWSEQILLPPEAQLVVTIADVARAGAPATALVETTIERPPPPPIRVGLPIEEQALDPRARYAARARAARRSRSGRGVADRGRAPEPPRYRWRHAAGGGSRPSRLTPSGRRSRRPSCG